MGAFTQWFNERTPGLGAVYKKMVIGGLHFSDVFANDNERAGSYAGSRSAWAVMVVTDPASPTSADTPRRSTVVAASSIAPLTA